VVEYDKNGNKIKTYESSKMASIITGFSSGLISYCCRNKKHTTAKGVIFRYERDGFDWEPYGNFVIDEINKKSMSIHYGWEN
jgi:hypothetical protein